MPHHTRAYLLALLLALFAGAHLPAQTVYTWQGTASSDAANAANWLGGNVPPFNNSPTVTNARISVSNGANNPLVYSATQGTTVFAANGGATSGRSLFIGSVVAGAMTITGGTFDSRGVSPDGLSNVSDGTLTIDGGTYLKTNGSLPTFLVKFSGSGTGTLNINSGSFLTGQLQFGDVSGSTGNGVVNLNGGLLSVHRAIEAGGTANAVNSTFNFNGGTLQARVDTADFMQNLNAANVLAGGAIIDTSGLTGTGVTVTMLQNLTGAPGDGGLTKTGPGTLILGGTNTYTGLTSVNQGALRITNASALGTTASGTTVANNARLEVSGGITVAGEALTISGNGSNNFGALQSLAGNNTWAGPITLAANGTRIGSAAPGASLTISGAIGDGGNNYTFAVRNADNGGPTILSGASTYGGNTDVVVGLLQLDGGADRLPTGTTLRIGNSSNVASAAFDLNGNNQQVAGLASLGTSMAMSVTNSSASTATLTVNNASSSTFSGTLTSNLNLAKQGAGTLTLSGANTYSGATTISAGTLALSGSGSINNSPSLAIAPGATFDVAARTGGSYTYGGTISGTGTINGQLTIGSGGRVAPGNSLGLLTVTGGPLTLNPGSTLEIELANPLTQGITPSGNLLLPDGSVNPAALTGGTPVGPPGLVNDRIAGNVTFASGSTLQVLTLDGLAPANLQKGLAWKIIDGTVTGNFSLAPGDFTLSGGSPGQFASVGGINLDLPDLWGGSTTWGYYNWDLSLLQSHGILVLVPEPSRPLLLAAALTPLLLRRRRSPLAP